MPQDLRFSFVLRDRADLSLWAVRTATFLPF